jgi:ubiquinone/menaquinone biosynthesis C-methylase UbiE
LALTERLGVLLGLDVNSHVLDVAAGPGTSALHLAHMFGCRVVGVDYGAANVAQAQAAAECQGLADRVEFQLGDAEQLSALPDRAFDAVICECAFCTFPDKRAAAREIARVLAPGGRFGLTDLTRDGELSTELKGIIAWIACIADAQPVSSYVDYLQAAGLRVRHVEDHAEALAALVNVVRSRLLAAHVVTHIRQVELPCGVDLQSANTVARSAAEAVKTGKLGYALIIARRDAMSA